MARHMPESLFVAACMLLGSSGARASGPLEVDPDNPRYFRDKTTNETVYLTGSHTWDLFTNFFADAPGLRDYEAFLDMMVAHHHNFLRLWTWSADVWQGNDHSVTPVPFQRTGPGTCAADGGLKYDLTRYDTAFFDRLRALVEAAEARGIYVSIMLFEGWWIKASIWNLWGYCVYNPANNINGFTDITNKEQIHTLTSPSLVALQEAYIEQVIDTVNSYGNVLYEIGNEDSHGTVAWQYELIHHIHEYESSLANQHPVGMTYRAGLAATNEELFASPAEWISPFSSSTVDYKNAVVPADGRKIILLDTDHLWGIGGTHAWAWKAFVRGHNPLFMDPYDSGWGGGGDTPYTVADWEDIRLAIGDTRTYALRVNMKNMTPQGALSSTGYCLADPSRSYVVYAPNAASTITVQIDSGSYRYEWFSLDERAVKSRGELVSSGGARQFLAGFAGDGVLFVTTAVAEPTVVITAPADGSVHEAGSDITMIAQATDADGHIAQVEFSVDGEVLGSDLTGPEYSFEWNDLPLGCHRVEATAVDDAGQTGSDTIEVAVTDGIAISDPWTASGSTYVPAVVTEGDTFYLDRDYTLCDIPDELSCVLWLKTANSDKGSTASPFLTFSVDRDARVLVGHDTRLSLPAWLAEFSDTGLSITDCEGVLFRLYGKTFPAGAVALGGNDGASGSMYLVLVRAAQDEPNVPPSVDIASPASGSSYREGTPIQLRADADDADGEVVRVAFFANDDSIGEATQSPFAIVWQPAAGHHTVYARAYDDQGLSAASASITIDVGEQQTPASWQFSDTTLSGSQFDAVAGSDGRLHVIAARYYQLNEAGEIVVDEAVGDGRQGVMDFPPAGAVAPDSSVHVVTRHDGSWNAGHDIRYRRRNTSGVWDRDYLVGSPAKRNYVVGISAPQNDEVLIHSGESGTDVWGDLNIWRAGAASATAVGKLSGIWRDDNDARMRAANGRVYLGSGLCDSPGNVSFTYATPGTSLIDELVAHLEAHAEGTGRHGFPDLYPTPDGATHMTYGAQSRVYYARWDANQDPALAADVLVLSDLGSWHLSTGLSAVAASDDSEIAVVVGLLADGTQGSPSSEILWTHSTDGGETWSDRQSLGLYTDAGEGRHRPRLAALGKRFFLFYEDITAAGEIHLATIDFSGVTPPCNDQDGDGYGDPSSLACSFEGQDCDDQNGDISPAQSETCNGYDDDCDGEVDPGCTDGSQAGDADLTPGDANHAELAAPGVVGSCGCSHGTRAGGEWATALALALAWLIAARRVRSRS